MVAGVINSTNDTASTTPVRTRKVIQATCVKHGGAREFTNLVLTKRGGEIELDPHATGACVLRLDDAAATAVRDQLTEWLG
jgi:hypothetical protein